MSCASGTSCASGSKQWASNLCTLLGNNLYNDIQCQWFITECKVSMGNDDEHSAELLMVIEAHMRTVSSIQSNNFRA